MPTTANETRGARIASRLIWGMSSSTTMIGIATASILKISIAAAAKVGRSVSRNSSIDAAM